MKHKINVISEGHRSRVIEIVKSLPLLPEYEVVIQERKKNRTASQNAMLWQWYTIIGNELGESKEDVHERYKSEYLVNIYERDNPEYAEMLETLRAVYREGMRDEALNLRKQIVSLTSTTTATTKQLSEYMESIERHAATLAIYLPHPED